MGLAQARELVHGQAAVLGSIDVGQADDVPHLVLIDTTRYRTQRSWVKGWYHNPIFPDSPYGSYFYPIYKEL